MQRSVFGKCLDRFSVCLLFVLQSELKFGDRTVSEVADPPKTEGRSRANTSSKTILLDV
jgi:hypothetical protein